MTDKLLANSDVKRQNSAFLILEDGSCFTGYVFGNPQSCAGEVVFNTGMVGYPEYLTDPSYSGQILVLTYPLIGNYGVPEENFKNLLESNFESETIQVKALVVSSYSDEISHRQCVSSFSNWLKKHGITGLYGIDTRVLTQKYFYKLFLVQL